MKIYRKLTRFRNLKKKLLRPPTIKILNLNSDIFRFFPEIPSYLQRIKISLKYRKYLFTENFTFSEGDLSYRKQLFWAAWGRWYHHNIWVDRWLCGWAASIPLISQTKKFLEWQSCHFTVMVLCLFRAIYLGSSNGSSNVQEYYVSFPIPYPLFQFFIFVYWGWSSFEF